MANDGILIRCPGCANAQSVAMAVGQQLQCNVCQTVFFAPVLIVPQPPSALPAAAESPKGTGPTSTSPPLGATAAHEPIRGKLPESRAAARETPARSWRTDGMDLDPASGATPPLSLGATAEDGPEKSAAAGARNVAPGGGRMVWLVIIIAAGLTIVAASLLVAIHFVRKAQSMTDAQNGDQPPVAELADSTNDPANWHWTDALHHAQRLGALELKVVRAKYGAVRAKDLNNEVITTDDTNLLVVTVSVRNRSAASHVFRSWYVGGVESEAGVEQLPELWDDAGRSYDLLRFDDVSSIEGQQLADEIEPHHDVQDTVVFLIPAEVDRSQIRSFRLSLPAHALGTADYFRFEIPVSMVVDF